MKKVKVLGVFALIGAAAIILSGCWPLPDVSQKMGEKMVEKSIEAGTGGAVKVDADKGQVNIQGQEGNLKMSAGEEVSLPDGFPKELILATDAKPFVATGGITGMSVAYYTDEDQSALYGKYKETIPTMGWKKTMEIDTGSGKMVNFTKGKANLSVTVGANTDSENPAKTVVHLIYVDGTEGQEDVTETPEQQ